MRTTMLLMTLVACTGGANAWHSYTPATGTTTHSKSTAIQRAVIAITDAGKEIETSDATSGIVLSRWFSGDCFACETVRFRVRVTVTDDKGYTVDALCQMQEPSMGKDPWVACKEPKRPKFVLDVVEKVDAGLR